MWKERKGKGKKERRGGKWKERERRGCAVVKIPLNMPWVARSLNCLHFTVCVALRCPGELNQGLNPQSQGQGLKFNVWLSIYSAVFILEYLPKNIWRPSLVCYNFMIAFCHPYCAWLLLFAPFASASNSDCFLSLYFIILLSTSGWGKHLPNLPFL